MFKMWKLSVIQELKLQQNILQSNYNNDIITKKPHPHTSQNPNCTFTEQLEWLALTVAHAVLFYDDI